MIQPIPHLILLLGRSNPFLPVRIDLNPSIPQLFVNVVPLHCLTTLVVEGIIDCRKVGVGTVVVETDPHELPTCRTFDRCKSFINVTTHLFPPCSNLITTQGTSKIQPFLYWSNRILSQLTSTLKSQNDLSSRIKSC